VDLDLSRATLVSPYLESGLPEYKTWGLGDLSSRGNLTSDPPPFEGGSTDRAHLRPQKRVALGKAGPA
jgi:hypothetical protein